MDRDVGASRHFDPVTQAVVPALDRYQRLVPGRLLQPDFRLALERSTLGLPGDTDPILGHADDFDLTLADLHHDDPAGRKRQRGRVGQRGVGAREGGCRPPGRQHQPERPMTALAMSVCTYYWHEASHMVAT